MTPATTPEPKTWTAGRVSPTDLNREVRDQIRDLQSRILALQAGGAGVSYPSGTIIAWAGTTIPTGFYLCDGSTKSTLTDSGLYTAIGNAYNTGGEAASEFRLPNFSSKLPRGGTGTSADGNPKSVGAGTGVDSLTLNHSIASSYSGSTNSTNTAHNHGSGFYIHNYNNTLLGYGIGAHTANTTHNHTVNDLTAGGGHNHTAWSAGGSHDHGGADSSAGNVSRPTGNLLTPLAHTHTISAETATTSTDGTHTHTVVSTTSSTFTAEDASVFFVNATGGASVASHSHDMTHDHGTFSDPHTTISTVPPSLGVNYLIKR